MDGHGEEEQPFAQPYRRRAFLNAIAIASDSDDGMSDDDQDHQVAFQLEPRRERIPLQFLRLIGGHRYNDHPASNNEELVNSLRRSGVVTSDSVNRAMRICARELFVPERYREDAYIDSPIRLEELEFNVSAPHMHATCLEALQVQPGHRVLDVGSGCGVLTACLALMAGRGGVSVGIDTKKAAVKLARDNVRNLTATNNEYATTAGPVKFEVHNVFMPSPKHKGMYDRIHVGATCPSDKLHYLLALLRPEGGIIVTPVWQNDLRAITKKPDGTVVQRVLSQVRYGDLEVPSDVEILMACLALERKDKTKTPSPPSTFAADISEIIGVVSGSPGSSFSDSSGLDQSPSTPFGRSTSRSSEGGVASDAKKMWGGRVARFFTSCSGTSSPPLSPTWSSASCGSMQLDSDGSDGRVLQSVLSSDSIGEADCLMQGKDWAMPVHRSVLRARCEQFRARCESGMKDAQSNTLMVPDHFSLDAMNVFLQYLYQDILDVDIEPELAATVLHVAHYYGAPRLAGLCEVALANELKGRDASDEGAVEAASMLLALADDNGLTHLKSVSLDFMIHNYAAVCASQSYKQLTKEQTDLVVAEACGSYSRIRQLVNELLHPDDGNKTAV